jgi:hypothetical protein
LRWPRTWPCAKRPWKQSGSKWQASRIILPSQAQRRAETHRQHDH